MFALAFLYGRRLLMDKEQLNIDEKKGYNIHRCEEYYNKVLLMEQPFYRTGMTSVEAKKELEYLNNNLNSFYNGDYQPLWKQSL